MTEVGGCPYKKEKDISECPFHQSNENSNVIDPSNNMPHLSQEPSETQSKSLPTTRQQSSIPKANSSLSESYWIYPSEQQFYNALVRKGKETKEEDISSIVSIHNEVNEKSWDEILKWEKLNNSLKCQPKLIRFQGKPEQLSPKARIFTLFNLSHPPFDRHDWIIDRCGKEVRYIIDYYEGRNDPKKAEIYVDVRPALDNISSFTDRMKMMWENCIKNN